MSSMVELANQISELVESQTTVTADERISNFVDDYCFMDSAWIIKKDN
ncbi:hypothetical protein RQN30_07360 [Arcanobacterium hippocoleae]|uniref:Uncharacterized protein n=1 Tax=Arcanobacterium hippocoleae TaxID=149017 RepID=A0ABU1T2C9_9ACTO|nr:hypothetical protein [Arcanobacterium hippocoleae]